MSQTKAQLLDGSVVSVSFGAGSAAAPSINYSADTTTGIYFPASTQLAFSTAGVQRLLINGTGNVNIPGTFSVTGQITAASGSVSTPSILLNGGGNPGIYSPAANQLAIVGGGSTFLTASSSALTATVPHVGPAGTATAASHQIGTGTTYAPGIYSPGTDQLAISTSGTGRVFVSSAGLVGIGTSSPNTALDVNGTINVRTNGYEFGRITTNNNSANQGGLTFQYNNTGTFTTGITLNYVGNVGIGTTGPGSILDIVGSGNPTLTLRGSDAAYTGIFNIQGASGGGSVISATGGGNFLAFNTNSSERAKIDSSGRLLVGTSNSRANLFNSTVSPLFQVEAVSGDGRFASLIYNNNSVDDPIFVLGKSRSGSLNGVTTVASGDGLGKISFQGGDGSKLVEGAAIRAEVDSTPGTGNMPGRLVFSTTANGAASPTERMRIGQDGVVNINSGKFKVDQGGNTNISITNDANANGFIFDTGDGGSGNRPKFRIRYGTADQIFLDGNGTAQKPGGGSWAATSDLRAKKDIVDYTSGLNQLKQIQPRSYRYIGNENTYIGLVAQEVEDAMPELVKQGEGKLPDGTEVTDFRTLDQTPLTFALINAVKEMAEQIDLLKAKVTALESA